MLSWQRESILQHAPHHVSRDGAHIYPRCVLCRRPGPSTNAHVAGQPASEGPHSCGGAAKAHHKPRPTARCRPSESRTKDRPSPVPSHGAEQGNAAWVADIDGSAGGYMLRVFCAGAPQAELPASRPCSPRRPLPSVDHRQLQPPHRGPEELAPFPGPRARRPRRCPQAAYPAATSAGTPSGRKLSV